jgi:XTP/dITP diphosphohydrolase
MLKLVLATNNAGKKKEIQEILMGLPIELALAGDFPGCPDSKEPYDTYLENAEDKARLVAEYTGCWALADDSGLEVDFLKGRPGVLSARFAGQGVSYEDNFRKVLRELEGVPEERRGALFRCQMVLRSPQGEQFVTEGTLEGRITEKPLGEGGFGYDPIFFLPEEGKTLAQMTLEKKNSLSHRRRALVKMLSHFRKLANA